MSRSNFKTRVVAFLSLTLTAGCVSGGNSSLSTVVDAIDGIQGSSSPVVDAYIQYLGPDARWAGPVLWTVHVSAHDSQAPVFEVTPALPRSHSNGISELSGRVPASALGLTQGKSVPAASGGLLTQEQVRDRLQHLGSAMTNSDNETAACMTAVKVRLTRADGTVQEKQACRGSAVWTQVASELAAEFMTQSRYTAAEASSGEQG